MRRAHVSGGKGEAKVNSHLRARLRAIAPGAPSAPQRAVGAGLTRRVYTHPAPEALYALDPIALARMGLEGDWPGIEGALFIDTETTGLSGGAGTIVFMAAMGYVKDGAFTIEQYTLGDYPDEAELIECVLDRMRQYPVIVSFNGRTFDLPLIQSRATVLRMRENYPSFRQLDLMHPARRLWKLRLGSYRLSLLEERVLGEGRTDDLPGSEAPKRFFEYIKCGDRTLLDPVMEHNHLDVVALGRLLARLCEAYARPEEQEEIADLYSMARTMERGGERALARRCYYLAGMPRPAATIKQLRGQRYAGEANRALSLMLRRDGDFEQAETLWRDMAARGQQRVFALTELAKLYEHRMRDYERALLCAGQALEAQRDAAGREQLAARCARLKRKLAAQSGAMKGSR